MALKYKTKMNKEVNYIGIPNKSTLLKKHIKETLRLFLHDIRYNLRSKLIIGLAIVFFLSNVLVARQFASYGTLTEEDLEPFYSFFPSIGISFLSLFVAFNIYARPKIKGELDFILSLPVSRVSLGLSRYLSGLTMFISTVVLTKLAIALAFSYIVPSIPFSRWLNAIYFLELFLYAVYYSIGMILSSLIRSEAILTISFVLAYIYFIFIYPAILLGLFHVSDTDIWPAYFSPFGIYTFYYAGEDQNITYYSYIAGWIIIPVIIFALVTRIRD